MSEFRKLLEQTKKIVDKLHAADPEAWIQGKKMTLHPSAKKDEIDEFYKVVGQGFPPSYREFLEASNGIEWSLYGLNFLGTDKKRQMRPMKLVVEELESFASRFARFQGSPTDKNIKEWEKRSWLYLPKHPILAISGIGSLLVCDSDTRKSNGEMEICFIAGGSNKTVARYSNIRNYFETILKEIKNRSS